jgi:hypothetical protein
VYNGRHRRTEEFHNDKFYNLYSSPYISVIQLNRFTWVEHMVNVRHECIHNLVGLDTKFNRKPKRQNMAHKDIGYKSVGCIQLVQETV